MTTKGSTIAEWMMTTPSSVSYRPMPMKATASGIDRIAIGNIFEESTARWNASRPGNRNRASAYPAGAPMARLRTIVPRATMMLFFTDGRTPVEFTKNDIVSVENWVGSSDFGNSYTERLVLNAATATR
jgi:hypothetical protein